MKIHIYIATGALCFSLASFGEGKLPSFNNLLNKFCEHKMVQKLYPYNPLYQENRKKFYATSDAFLSEYPLYQNHIKPIKNRVTIAFAEWKKVLCTRWQILKGKNNS